MNEVQKAIVERRSIRKFSGEQITDQQFDELLKCVLTYPSGKNARPLHFSVVQDRELLSEFNSKVVGHLTNVAGRQLPEGYDIFYHAPTVFLISRDTSEMWADVDLGIAAQTLCIAAQSMGLGSIIIGMLRVYADSDAYDASYNDKFKVPEGHKLGLAVAIGHAKDAPNPPPNKEKYAIIK